MPGFLNPWHLPEQNQHRLVKSITSTTPKPEQASELAEGRSVQQSVADLGFRSKPYSNWEALSKVAN